MNKIIINLLLSSSLVMAMSGLEVMQKVENRDTGDNSISTIQMQLIDKSGQKRIKEIKTFFKKDGKRDLKASFFLAPSDIKNTAFLTYDNIDKDDDQWMFLPALNKVKRIPSSDKSNSFMGSDFSYSDMTKTTLSDFDFKILKDSIIKRKTQDGVKKVKIWIIQKTPKTQKVMDETGYKKSILYVRKDNFIVSRAKFYIQNSQRVKYLDVKKIKNIDGIFVSTLITMTTKESKRTIHKTILIQKDIKMNQNLNKNLFTTRSISKGI